MNIYRLSADAFVMGEQPHETYGWSYRAFTYDSDFPLQWSSKHQGFLKDVAIVAEKSEKKKAKFSGNEYLWLTGVKIADGGQGEERTLNPSPTPSVNEPKGATPIAPKSAVAKLYNPDYAKDLTDIPIRLYTGNLNYAQNLGLNLIDNKTDRLKYYEYIQDVSEELLTWTLNIRAGEDIKKTAEGLFPGGQNG